MRVYFSVITAMAGAMKFSRMSVFFVRSILLVNSTVPFLCMFYKIVDACMLQVHSVQSCFSFQDVSVI